MILGGRDVAAYIQERHFREVAGLSQPPTLAIVVSETEASRGYLKAKLRYGQEIGMAVELVSAERGGLIERIDALNRDTSVTGIIVQLPLPDPKLTDQVLALIDPRKDVDGLGPNSSFDVATPKGILYLLAAYNIDLGGQVAVVGQGRLVGKPLADMLEASGRQVVRMDIETPNLAQQLAHADIIVAATGQLGVITSDMVKPGAVVVDVGSPDSELADDVRQRSDISYSPNPGGVGPMTVAALFDNVLIASRNRMS